MIRMIAGDFDYNSIEESNNIFGPLLFVFFVLFSAILVMVLLACFASDSESLHRCCE